jgi:hypothetical protein
MDDKRPDVEATRKLLYDLHKAAEERKRRQQEDDTATFFQGVITIIAFLAVLMILFGLL